MENIVDAVTKTAVAFDDGMAKYSAVQSLLYGKDLTSEEVQSLRSFKCVQDFLDIPMNDPAEVGLKKTFASALRLAKEFGVLPVDLNDIQDIASVAEEALFNMKLTYKVAIGEITPLEAVDCSIDHGAAKAVALLDRRIDNGADWLKGKVSGFLERVNFPGSQKVAKLSNIAISFASDKVKDLVHSGSPIIANCSKKVVHAVADTVSYVGSKVKAASSWVSSKVSSASSTVSSAASSVISTVKSWF